jgi:hypothetical protein
MKLLSNKTTTLTHKYSFNYRHNFKRNLKIVFFIIVMFHPLFLMSQKGKKLIQEEKYSQASDFLMKALTKDSSDIETNYYLSVLYIQEKANEYFSINLAHEYYVKTKHLYNSLKDEKTLEKLKNKDISDEKINMIHDSIINVGYRIAKSKNIEQSYIDFIKLDNQIPEHLIIDAINSRNNCAFNDAKKTNTISSYNNFLLKYPNTSHQIAAKDLRDSLAYLRAKEINSIEAYKEYIKIYFDSKSIIDAQLKMTNLVYDEVKKQNTISSYELFIEEYPNSSLVYDANNKIDELLYNQIIQENSIEKCYILINKSPQSKYIDSVNTILENLRYKELLNHLRISEIESFNNEFPNSSRKIKLLNTLDSLYYIVLISTKNEDKIQEYMIKYPNSRYLSEYEKIISNFKEQRKIEAEYYNSEYFICFENEKNLNHKLSVGYLDDSPNTIKNNIDNSIVKLEFIKGSQKERVTTYITISDSFLEITNGLKNGNYTFTHSGIYDYILYVNKLGIKSNFTIILDDSVNDEGNGYRKTPCF